MSKLSPLQFGLAVGVTGAIFYIGCMIFMAMFSEDTVIWFSNSLLHGIDVQQIVRHEVPVSQSIAGIISMVIGGLIFGAITAVIYNFSIGKSNAKD